jgi:hypothetical protein
VAHPVVIQPVILESSRPVPSRTQPSGISYHRVNPDTIRMIIMRTMFADYFEMPIFTFSASKTFQRTSLLYRSTNFNFFSKQAGVHSPSSPTNVLQSDAQKLLTNCNDALVVLYEAAVRRTHFKLNFFFKKVHPRLLSLLHFCRLSITAAGHLSSSLLPRRLLGFSSLLCRNIRRC